MKLNRGLIRQGRRWGMDSNGWISVKDRLPSEVCTVLVAKINGKIMIMSYHAPFDSGKRMFQWWAFGKWQIQDSQVTHWMQLPKLPNEKEATNG